MAKIIRLPKLGETMIEGVITRWIQKEGEELKKGAPLYEVETEKLTSEIPNVEEGVLLKIIAQPGSTIPVGAPLAVVGKRGDTIPSVTDDETEESTAAPAVTKQSPTAAQASSDRVKISPIAKKIAEEHNLDVTQISGTGPDGRITKEDVEQAIKTQGGAAQPPAQIPSRMITLSQMRKTIARTLRQSVDFAVHSTLTREVDCDPLVAYRQKIVSDFEKKHGIRITYTDLTLKLAVEALKANPLLNSTFAENGIKVFDTVNLGVAVGVEDGLIVPAIHGAEKLSTEAITKARATIVEKTKANKLALDDLAQGTFTISNLGMYNIDAFSPVINYPQAAILGVGRIREIPVVKDGKIAIGNRMILSITFDHRVVDGVQAAQFLDSMARMLLDPSKYAPIA